MADGIAGVTAKFRRTVKARTKVKPSGDHTAQTTQATILLPDGRDNGPELVDAIQLDVREARPHAEPAPPISLLPVGLEDHAAHEEYRPAPIDPIPELYPLVEPAPPGPPPLVGPKDDAAHEWYRAPQTDPVLKSHSHVEATPPVHPPLIGPEDHSAHDTYRPAPADHVREKLHMPEPSHLRRKGFYSDMPDKGLFLGFALLGFAGIFIAKYTGFPGLWTAVGALALLATYAILAFRLDGFKANPDSLGDNCYYMGFLFTLASLSAALVALDREAASGRGDLLEALIGSFGVALFSTIGGITLRVVFMQMRREIVDLEEQLRTELQRSASLLKDQLASAVMDLENLRIRTKQVMDQHTDEAAVGFSRVADKLVGYVTSAGSAYSAASERLAVNADRVASEIERLVNRVDKIDVPSDLLTRQVDDARVRIHALASALEVAADAGGKRQEVLDQSSKTLDLLLTKLTQVSTFSDIEKSAGQLGSSMDIATEKMAAVGKQLDQYALSVGRTTSQIDQNSQAVSRARATISEDLVQSTDALHKLQGTLADVADGLVDRLNAPLASPERPISPQEI
jgi:hypothetical protein